MEKVQEHREAFTEQPVLHESGWVDLSARTSCTGYVAHCITSKKDLRDTMRHHPLGTDTWTHRRRHVMYACTFRHRRALYQPKTYVTRSSMPSILGCKILYK